MQIIKKRITMFQQVKVTKERGKRKMILTKDDKQIKRTKVMAGILVKKAPVILDDIDDKITNLNINYGYICRKILFQKNSYDVAIDLLYNSPPYEIENFQNGGYITKEGYIIKNAIRLNSLLAYYQFDKILDEHDVKKIYSMFLRKDRTSFYLDNCDLFGLEVNESKIFKLSSKQFTNLTIRNVRRVEGGHPIDSKCFDLIDIISYSKRPSKLEREDEKIKKKILTLFD